MSRRIPHSPIAGSLTRFHHDEAGEVCPDTPSGSDKRSDVELS